jgi:tetratricopeptide (TPR) repeat protein
MKKCVLFLPIIILILSACSQWKAPSQPSTAGAKDYKINLDQGVSALDQGDYEKAIFYLSQASAINPQSSMALNLLGIAYFQKKEYQLAKTQFEKAIALKPSYAEAFNNLGGAYFALRDLEKAKEMFKKAISLSPNIISPYYSLGNLLLAQGNTEESLFYLAKGIALDPEYLDKHQSFVTEVAMGEFKTSELYFSYARLFAAAGNVEKTLEYLEKAEKAHFQDWERILNEKEFEKVKDNPRIQEFIKRIFPK